MRDPADQNMRDQMDEIRAVGKGSRGGPGSRQRRNGGKPLTRRPSAREDGRNAIKMDALERRLRGLFSESKMSAADRMLTHQFKVKAMVKLGSPAFWPALAKQPSLKFIVEGDQQHRAAAAYAYSLYIATVMTGTLSVQIAIIGEVLAEQLKSSGRKRKLHKIASEDDLLRAIVRLAVKFDGPDERDDRYQVWRLAAAIRYFISLDKGPEQIEDHFKECGGGLDSWARLAPKDVVSSRKEIALGSGLID